MDGTESIRFVDAVASDSFERTGASGSLNGRRSGRTRALAFVALGVALLLLTAPNQAAALYANLAYMWSGSPVVIPVCFENPAPWNEQARTLLRQAVETTWQREARINFTQWDTCQSGEAGLHILFTDSGPSSAPHGRELNGVNSGVKLNVFHTPRTYLHEFGHALGFYHEEERPEYSPGSAANPVDRNGNGTWDHQEDACRKQTYPNSRRYFFGAYDVDSVMSYCATEWDARLSPNDVAAVRRAYGIRIPGSLVSPHGYCVESDRHLGDRAYTSTCDEYLNIQEFDLDNGLLRHGTAPTLCLHATGGGDVVRNEPCAGSSIARWDFMDVYVRGWGNTCLELPGGNTVNGAVPLRAAECDEPGGWGKQRWTIKWTGPAGSSVGEIRYENTNKCVTAFPGNGSAVLLYDCEYSTQQRFEFRSGGQIRLASSPGFCLDAPGPRDSDYANTREGRGVPGGAPLQTFACQATQTNQKWHFRGPIIHRATGQCLNRESGHDVPGMSVRLGSDCFVSWADWDYYFK